MAESQIWSMDRIAAAALLQGIGLEATDDRMEQVAAHFARHRHAACEWAAERVHGTILAKLESDSLDLLHRYGDEWAEGFHRAEQEVMTMLPQELLGIEPRTERTRGQFLRTMVRSARQQGMGR